MALEPLVNVFPNARFISKTVFAIGIIGIGFMTIPVLGGSCAYSLSDVFGQEEGLGKKFRQAKPYYFIIAISTLLGLSINLVIPNQLRD